MNGTLMPLIEGMMASRPDLAPPSKDETYTLHDVVARGA